MKSLKRFLPDPIRKQLSKIKRNPSIRFFRQMLVQKYMLSLTLEQIAAFHKRRYEKETGTKLDYEHPKNMCEKLQQLMIYDAQPYKTQWTDKRLAKELAREKIGEEHIVKTLGVWKSFDEIDFDKLPDSFVLKATHGSRWNTVVEDKSKLDKAKVKKRFDRWMKLNYGATPLCELQYRKIEPYIIAEELLKPKSGDLIDYKITMLKGEPKGCAFLDKKTNTCTGYLIDQTGSFIFLENSAEKIDPPENMDEMLTIAKKLCAGMDFVRADLYDVDGKIYFGELTFTPSAFRGFWRSPEAMAPYYEITKEFAHSGLPEKITEL